jgi:LmbE family N-acetylglucosaminyl deacetylase
VNLRDPEGRERSTSSSRAAPYPVSEGAPDLQKKTTPVLVVSPHPDDAESGAGGIIAQWARQGRKIILVVCTNGDKGTSDRSITPESLAEIREDEQRKAAKVTGVSEVMFLRYPDQSLEDTAEFREKLVRQIRTYRPETVVTVDPSRLFIRHRDHYMTGRVTLDAVFPYARDHLAYPEHLEEGLEPHGVREVYLWGAQEPDTFLDVTDTFETKLEALKRHQSQVGQGWELREIRARTRYENVGKKIGVQFAEAFKRVEVF